MARSYIHHDHYCDYCGHKMEDGEEYIQTASNKIYCEKCWDEGVDWYDETDPSQNKD